MSGKVFFAVSMSLDGFVVPETMDWLFASPEAKSADPTLARCMTQWMELQQWIFPTRFFRESLKLGEGGETGPDDDVARATFARTGASVMGRRMFDLGERSWPDEAPFRTPVFVVTHRARAPWERPGGTTFHFETEGVAAAVARAREAAGGRDVRVAGGPETLAQVVDAGLVDECSLAISPVLFGSGTRLFDRIDARRVALEPERTVVGTRVTHVTYRVKPRR